MLSGVKVLMAIMIAENINNRKPEGRFSTFNLDIIEKVSMLQQEPRRLVPD